MSHEVTRGCLLHWKDYTTVSMANVHRWLGSKQPECRAQFGSILEVAEKLNEIKQALKF